MTPSGIRRVVRYCCRNGGVGEPGVKNSPHAIRHAFARDYVKAGANVITLMNALGHSSLEMSRKYVRLAEGDMSEQHAKLSPVDALRDRERKKTQR
jgi:integrase/recombinase XerD